LHLVKTKTHFQFRLDLWDAARENILEHLAGTDDFELSEAMYRPALTRWPESPVILRHGVRTVHDSGPRSVIA